MEDFIQYVEEWYVKDFYTKVINQNYVLIQYLSVYYEICLKISKYGNLYKKSYLLKKLPRYKYSDKKEEERNNLLSAYIDSELSEIIYKNREKAEWFHEQQSDELACFVLKHTGNIISNLAHKICDELYKEKCEVIIPKGKELFYRSLINSEKSLKFNSSYNYTISTPFDKKQMSIKTRNFLNYFNASRSFDFTDTFANNPEIVPNRAVNRDRSEQKTCKLSHEEVLAKSYNLLFKIEHAAIDKAKGDPEGTSAANYLNRGLKNSHKFPLTQKATPKVTPKVTPKAPPLSKNEMRLKILKETSTYPR